MREAVAGHASNNLVLAGHVELVKHFVKLLLHLEHFILEFLHASILLRVEELQVCCLSLRLAQC